MTLYPPPQYFEEIMRVSKQQIIWGGNYFALPPSKGFLIWDKKQPESFTSSMCEMAWMSRNSPAKMYKEWVVGIEKFHPTTKPIELMRWCLSLFPESLTILDPFGGSGTTAVAAKQLKRSCTLIEISPKYCEIAGSRLSQEMLF